MFRSGKLVYWSLLVTCWIPIAIHLHNQDDVVIAVALFLWPIMALLASPIKKLIRNKQGLGYTYQAFSLILVLIMTLLMLVIRNEHADTRSFEAQSEQVLGVMLMIGIALLLVLFLLATSLNFILYRRKMQSSILTIENATAPIDAHAATIGETFTRFSKAISEERDQLALRMEEFHELVLQLQSNAASSRTEIELMKAELATYKAAAKLSKEEQHDFLRILDRRKYFEYLVGFAVGILSSLVASVAWLILERIIKSA